MNPETHSAPKNILVTGGGGFLGKAIVHQLLAEGHRVSSFSRAAYPELEGLGVHQHTGDLADAGAVQKAVTGMDVVFHTAAKAGVWGPFEDFFRPNVTGTRNVIEACRACSVGRLIYTSSPSVVFDGTDMEGVNETAPYPADFHAPYPRTKAMAEQEVTAAAEENLRTLSLRPHLIWGPGDPNFAPRIIARAKSLRQVGDGGNRVDTIYIDNAARAHLLGMQALDKKPEISGKAYFISDDAPIVLWEMINRILDAGGKPPVRRRISPEAAYRIGAVLEWIYRTFGIKKEPKMTRFLARELATSHWFDISAAKRDLGYTAEVSIDEGMRRLKTWLSEAGFTSD